MSELDAERIAVYDECSTMAEAVASSSASTLRLAFGEMSAQEIRSVRAVMSAFAQSLRNKADFLREVEDAALTHPVQSSSSPQVSGPEQQ